MQCPRCDRDAPADAAFCPKCGSKLGAACPHCGTGVAPDDNFCRRCGNSLSPSLTDVSERFATPQAYTPQHLAQKILISKSALEGERKQVTVLFADLKGSMELLADRDPEEARKILDPVLEQMMEAVHRFEGTVNQVMGDGIMALFGAPLAHEDHAIRACYAALRMQASIEEYAYDVQRDSQANVKIRIGINSGEVVVRAIGSDLRMDYTAVGQTTHVAARLEQHAEPGTTLLSAETARLAQNYFEMKALEPVQLKGLRHPISIHRLVRSRPSTSRVKPDTARGRVPFIGRTEELASLAQALELAANGSGQVVGVVGEPGIGKSRLIWEFLRGERRVGWRVLHANALPYRVDHLPLTTLIRDALDLEEESTPSVVRGTISASLGDDHAARRLHAPLLSVLEIPFDDEEWANLDDESRRRRILEAVKHLLLIRSRLQPLCVVVEDLQWADAETTRILEGLVEALPAARILLITTYRPEFVPTWTAKTYYRQLPVHRLTAADARSLLKVLIGDARSLAPLEPLLIERTEGNPFFLEESVRNVVEAGLGEMDGQSHGTAASVMAVPDSVHAVLAARIDRLNPDDKHLLQIAAVIGREVSVPLLGLVAAVPDSALELSLKRLRAAEFLDETAVFPERTSTFRHALTLDVAFSSLVSDSRRALDARIVEAIERLYPKRTTEHLDRLAHHSMRGGLWLKATDYCREAGSRACARSAHRAAIVYFENALTALDHLPASQETSEKSIDIRMELRHSLGLVAEYSRMLDVLMEAQRVAEALGDARRRARVAAFLTNYFTLAGKLDRAIEYGEHARVLASGVDDVSLVAVVHATLAAAYFARGDYRRAIEVSRRNLELLVDGLEHERFGMSSVASVYSRMITVWSFAELGEFASALEIGRDALRIAEAADHHHSIVMALIALGTLRLRRGDFEGAIEALERARTLCETADLPAALLEVAGPLSSAYAQSGRSNVALTLLEQISGMPIARRHALGRLLRTAGLGEVYLCAGRAEAALPLALKFLEAVRSVGARGLEAWAWRLVGECAARAEPPECTRAMDALDTCLALAGELGMRPLVGGCHLTRAMLYDRTARHADATEERRQAIEEFTRLGMADAIR
jgi:class 3 adenylate cyclase/tetratricopeptide (TPR) repeat protein